MKKIDINVDIGEGFDYDRDLLLFASSANICCGAHAGSWDLTRDTIGLALDAGTRIGMHPGYPDRENMGRRTLEAEQSEEFALSIREQVDQFFNFVPASYIKPHGAFYNDSIAALHPAFSILRENVLRFNLTLMGLPGSAHATVTENFIVEGFADRGYTPQGTLIPRGMLGDLLQSTGEIRSQVVKLTKLVDSICIHGDTPYCVEVAENVYAALVDAGFEVGT